MWYCSWSCNFRGAGRRKTGFAAVSIVFEALQAVYAVLRTFGGRAAAAPVVVPLEWWPLASQSAATWHQFTWPASVT